MFQIPPSHIPPRPSPQPAGPPPGAPPVNPDTDDPDIGLPPPAPPPSAWHRHPNRRTPVILAGRGGGSRKDAPSYPPQAPPEGGDVPAPRRPGEQAPPAMPPGSDPATTQDPEDTRLPEERGLQ